MSTGAFALAKDDLAPVREVWDALIAANLTTDWDAFQRHATEDFVQLDPRSPPLVGIKAWREWADSLDLGDVNARFDVDELAGNGDLAYVRWSFAGSWTEGGEVMETQGKGLSLFRKSPDGSWRISHNVWNSNP